MRRIAEKIKSSLFTFRDNAARAAMAQAFILGRRSNRETAVERDLGGQTPDPSWTTCVFTTRLRARELIVERAAN
jgi:hypothetical protein